MRTLCKNPDAWQGQGESTDVCCSYLYLELDRTAAEKVELPDEDTIPWQALSFHCHPSATKKTLSFRSRDLHESHTDVKTEEKDVTSVNV